MSDEIQAIATNNYLLATQQEVSHDSTLSGNGTLASPLGVVNGYNETVLYSSQGDVSASLSEPMTNFERLKIKLGCYLGADGCQYTEVPAAPSAIKNLTYNAGGGANFYFICLYCSADENSITVNKEAALVKSFGNTNYNGQAEVTGYKYALHEVVGINRIANS